MRKLCLCVILVLSLVFTPSFVNDDVQVEAAACYDYHYRTGYSAYSILTDCYGDKNRVGVGDYYMEYNSGWHRGSVRIYGPSNRDLEYAFVEQL